LKALQMRVSWLYVVPEASYLDTYKAHWNWVKLELGRTRSDAPDAWAFMREAEDDYWNGDDSVAWEGKPFVKNFERWLVQKDAAPDGKSLRGTDVHIGELTQSNKTAYEGRRTDPSNGQHALYFDLDDLVARRTRTFDLKVTLRSGPGTVTLKAAVGGKTLRSQAAKTEDTENTQTVTFRIDDARFDGTLPGNTDFALVDDGTHPLQVEFVRVILR
jgi:hypothetical protein